MTEESGKSVRNFPCSFRAAQERLSLPYTCSAPPVTTVSALRTHLKRPLPGKRPPHLAFLKRCPTCNEDILDKLEFEERHGTEKCTTPRPQRKGDEGQARQYEMLCAKVERHIRNAALNADQSGVRNTSIADPPHVLIRDTVCIFPFSSSCALTDHSSPRNMGSDRFRVSLWKRISSLALGVLCPAKVLEHLAKESRHLLSCRQCNYK